MNNIELDLTAKSLALVTAVIGLSLAIRSVLSQDREANRTANPEGKLRLIKLDRQTDSFRSDFMESELERATKGVKFYGWLSAFYVSFVLFGCIVGWWLSLSRMWSLTNWVQFGNWFSGVWFLYVAFANHNSRQLIVWHMNHSRGAEATNGCKTITREALFKANFDEVVGCCYKACRNLDADLVSVDVNSNNGTGCLIASKISYKLGYAPPFYPRERIKVTVEQVGQDKCTVRLETPLVRRNSYGFPAIFLDQLHE